ncbi:GNAT family N-acetyltransferase [Lysinibacillus sp. 2017]|uniref:GNAT family N-acetyltransferase n=1 Tax=unclassified Lysinibacillus TaxID=2636778 RepID=UPI000D52A511|nr:MULTISPECIES: GNAT family protein [unclassified Lysinibacillus]AWE07372.1 GNAT family N-acetyltransferase [Lysinibacillus sp. 2017]TGN36533.1 N-acetyltransferase [Lysinibacillus sp. S2017]
MKLYIENLNGNMANEILNWKYDKPYDFYNNEVTDEAMKEILDGSYYAIVDELKELIGFFCMGENAQVPIGKQFGVYIEDFVDMGLGMNPNLVGRGNGYEFCSFIIKFIQENCKSTPIRLTVAKFNLRAIHLYEKLGFVAENEFSTDFAEFMTMVKKVG